LIILSLLNTYIRFIKTAGLVASNHYNTLNISPNATSIEIKKAYRKLALIYHPDVAHDDPIAAEKFRMIKNAYDVLGNTKSRQQYHYQHYYTNIKTTPVVTINSIVSQCNELLAFTKALDPYRLDTEGLYQQIVQLVDEHHITILLKSGDKKLTETIILNLLNCSQLLPFKKALSIHTTLLTLTNNNHALMATINKQTQWQKMLHYWDQYKLLLAMAITITLCLLFLKWG